MTKIFEYLELLQIYFDLHEKYTLKSTVQNLLIITKKIISHHLNNKKRIILESKMYNIDIINDFISKVANNEVISLVYDDSEGVSLAAMQASDLLEKYLKN